MDCLEVYGETGNTGYLTEGKEGVCYREKAEVPNELPSPQEKRDSKKIFSFKIFSGFA